MRRHKGGGSWAALARFACAVLAAGLAQAGPASPGTVPPEGFGFDVDVPYGAVSERQRLDILYPRASDEPCPGIVLIHSGGWYTGGKGGERTFAMMRRFAEAGYVALSIEYRLSGEAPFPAAVEDCKLAVRWLRAHADTYHIDPDHIGAMGASAGGHLSALLAVAGPDAGLEGDGGFAEFSSAVQAAVPVCAPLDLRLPLTQRLAGEDDPLVVGFLGGSLAEKADAARAASPVAYVRAGLPPLLLIHGSADNRVNLAQSEVMANALKNAGAESELIVVEDGKHGMDIAREESVFQRVLAFFGAHLKPSHRDVAGITAERSAALERWKDAKFGLFIHWGPSSITGKEISWSRGGERPGMRGLPLGDVPRDVYDQLYAQFDPVEFDASEWVAIARAAGMKYLVFTTKHHDGFCMFDTELSDYQITNSPFRRDAVAELAEACHADGLGLGLYYSLPDWHHPDYLTVAHGRYIAYLHGQVRELCTRYGRIDEIWFDGKRQGTAETWDSERLLAMIRQLQPAALVNDRVWGATDFDTPEQVIGRFELDRPWESCVTLGQQWSWKPGDDIKTWQECVKLLVRAVGGGGNLLLNVGPTPTGAIEPRQVETLKAVGAWLGRYGEAIYGTRGGPYAPSYWGASTRRGEVVYLHLLEGWEAGLRLSPLERKVTAAAILDGRPVTVRQTGEALELDVPEEDRTPPVTIVRLTVDGPVSTIAPKPSGMTMPAGATATASNVRRGETRYAPEKAVDDDPMSRWATDDGVAEAWLEIHLPQPATFDVIMIDEAFGSRVQAFEISVKDGARWKTIYTGTAIGRNWAGRVDPVTAQDLRIEISRATDGPTFRDIQLHCSAEE